VDAELPPLVPEPSRRLVAVEPLSTLTPEEQRLLARAIERPAQLAESDLAVYRCDDAVIVAPAGAAVRIGSRLESRKLSAVLVNAYEDGSALELRVAGELAEAAE
jgi:hypothetical protein